VGECFVDAQMIPSECAFVVAVCEVQLASHIQRVKKSP